MSVIKMTGNYVMRVMSSLCALLSGKTCGRIDRSSCNAWLALTQLATDSSHIYMCNYTYISKSCNIYVYYVH